MKHEGIGKIVEVTWLDTVSRSSGWMSPDNAAIWFKDDMGEYKSVGYLFEVTDKYVALIRSHHGVTDGNVNDLMQFPLQAVVSIRDVKTGRKVKLP